MKKRKIDKVADGIFLCGIAVCIVYLTISACIGGSKAEATQETPSASVVAETTEANTEPTEAEVTTEAVTEPAKPSVQLYDVPLDDELQLFIINLCEEKHIDPAIIMAMAWKESTYNPGAIGDSGNALGLLQVQPHWHYARMERLGCTDLLDPYQNVTVAVDYLCELLSRYGSIDKALTAYNQGHYAGTVTSYATTVMAKAEGLGVA